MKTKIFFLAVLAVLLAGCTQGNPNKIDEKTVPQRSGAYDESAVLNRINDIKNGATPQTTSDKKSNSTDGSSQTEPKQSSTVLKINQETKNMNMVTVKTNKGTFKIKLNAEKAPVTVENFKKYANSGFFTNTIFHRVMPGFMVQGGGFGLDGNQKPVEEPIKIESDNGLNNSRGTVAMARTQVPDSATAQFFVNLVDNDFLNYSAPTTQGYGYAVFGEVIEGMDTVDAIAKVDTANNGPHQNWPVENVIIESVELSE